MSGAIATAAIVGGIGAAGSIGGAAIASSAAGKAASTQSDAAKYSADLQYQASQNALDFQKQQYEQSQQNLAPWLQTGKNSLSSLSYLMGLPSASSQQPAYPGGSGSQQIVPGMIGQSPVSAGGSGVGPGGVYGIPSTMAQSSQLTNIGTIGNLPASPGGSASSGPGMGVVSMGGNAPQQDGFGSLMQGYGKTFSAPTGLDEQNDPGYQARLKLGTDAIQRSAAARGGLVTGGTAKALDTYGQDYGSNEYNNVYNRAYNTFSSNYNQYNQDQTNKYNRLASLAGIGQQTASTLGTLGQENANTQSGIVTNAANNIAQQNNNAAAATASGYAANGNIWGSALNGLGGNLANLYQLSRSGQSSGMDPYTFNSLMASGTVQPATINSSIYTPSYSI